jgi:hypothetical protein
VLFGLGCATLGAWWHGAPTPAVLHAAPAPVTRLPAEDRVELRRALAEDVRLAVVAALPSSGSRARAEPVLRLSADLGSSTGWGIVFPDDQVGPAQLVEISQADLMAARKGVHKLPTVVCQYLKGSNGNRDTGEYELSFSIVAAGAG